MVRSAVRDDTSSGTRSRSMKHVTRACLGCQKRKTKCNGAKPQCANCALYKQECVFSQEVDKRQIAPKGKISMLMTYVQALECLLSQHHIELPDSRPSHILPSAPLPPSIADSSDAIGAIAAEIDELPDPPVEQLAPTVSTGTLSDAQDRPSLSGESSYGMSPLPDRMGSLQIAEDGQLRFFGPTSNLHISHVGPFPLFNSNIRSIHWNENLILKAAGVDHPVDAELEDHLTKLYFTWENPNIPLVHEDTYWREKNRYRELNQVTHRYSEVLNNAICAVGATLTPRYSPNLPESLVDFFATRSKALLEVEMDSPTLSTVQSLGILSGVEALLTRDARGWLYSGMAMRLATDLGLHINAIPFAERGLMDLDEARLRSHTFWGTYTHERMWSLYVGRPESIDHLDITVPLSSQDSCHEVSRRWSPYVDEDQQGSSWDVLAYVEEVAQSTVILCTKMASIRKVLYSTPRGNTPDLKKLYSFATNARSDLGDWLLQLPERLTVNITDVDRKCPPHILQLHMQYHAVRIIIDHPFAHLPFGADGLSVEDIEKSRGCCHDAAFSITRLVQTIRRHFSLRRINIQAVHLIFTAMLVHVHSAFLSSDYQARDAARRQLEICSQAMGEIGQAYKSALRALEVITSIKSDLLRRERRALTDGLQMFGQPDPFSSTNALGQMFPSPMVDDTGNLQAWPSTLSNENLLGSFFPTSATDLDNIGLFRPNAHF